MKLQEGEKIYVPTGWEDRLIFVVRKGMEYPPRTVEDLRRGLSVAVNRVVRESEDEEVEAAEQVIQDRAEYADLEPNPLSLDNRAWTLEKLTDVDQGIPALWEALQEISQMPEPPKHDAEGAEALQSLNLVSLLEGML